MKASLTVGGCGGGGGCGCKEMPADRAQADQGVGRYPERMQNGGRDPASHPGKQQTPRPDSVQ